MNKSIRIEHGQIQIQMTKKWLLTAYAYMYTLNNEIIIAKILLIINYGLWLIYSFISLSFYLFVIDLNKQFLLY